MKLASRILSLAVLFASILAFAETEKVLSVQELVDQFYAQKKSPVHTMRLLTRHPLPPPVNCYPAPNSEACLDSVCQKLGHFGCDDLREIQEVTKTCRGNYDTNCLDTVCSKLGHFGCDDLREIQTVTRACVGNYDMSCFNSVCSRLGHFGCDDSREIEDVLRTCTGN